VVGLSYPDRLLDLLAAPAGLRYDPAPCGAPAARAEISSHLAARGVEVAPDRVILTASTSEAYSLLFKLLCDRPIGFWFHDPATHSSNISRVSTGWFPARIRSSITAAGH
jgi:DNA-binding transcriptional MocR family regulator